MFAILTLPLSPHRLGRVARARAWLGCTERGWAEDDSPLSSCDGCGHVFVVQGDVRRLSADAILIPTTSLESSEWFPNGPPVGAEVPHGHRFTTSHRVVNVRPRMYHLQGAHLPALYLAQFDGTFAPPLYCDYSGRPRLSWIKEAVHQFLLTARNDLLLADSPPLHGRAVHLIALPVVGIGPGGVRERSGHLIEGLLLLLQEFVRRSAMDVVLVVEGVAMFSAAQALRRERVGAGPEWEKMLSERLCARAKALAKQAANQQLCLFLGAGVSVGAGLPQWQELLTSIAARDELGMEAEAVEQLRTLELVDQADVLSKRLGESRLQELVIAETSAKRCSLTHALLAALPANAVVTTNYDSLFETAWDAINAEYTVLPYETQPSERFILKLHGDVRKPEDIVITRSQMTYTREQRPALSGIVETILITKHMLFVGFSLQDPNFSELAGAVRRALAGRITTDEGERRGFGAVDTFGTLLTLHNRPLLNELWPDLKFVPMDTTDGAAPNACPSSVCARRMEIFLDKVSLETVTSTPHLLNEDFAGILSEDEAALKGHLVNFCSRLQRNNLARKSRGYATVADLLHKLGARPDPDAL